VYRTKNENIAGDMYVVMVHQMGSFDTERLQKVEEKQVSARTFML